MTPVGKSPAVRNLQLTALGHNFSQYWWHLPSLVAFAVVSGKMRT
jgi:hypothetical protein